MSKIPWFKVDDNLVGNKKFARIPRPERMAAAGLWAFLGSWSARELTNGEVEDHMISEVGGTQKQAAALVAAGLWERMDGGGYRFVNWGEYQPTREDVERSREQARDRMRRVRGSSPDVRANSERTSDAVTLTPTRPVPIPVVPTELPTNGAQKRATQLPQDWQPSVEHYAFAADSGIDMDHEVEQFRNHHLAKGSTFKSWNAAFRTWLGNAKKWSRTPDGRPDLPEWMR